MGDRPFGARTRFELARLLLGRGDAATARGRWSCSTSALDTAQEIGMAGLVRQALEARLEAHGLTALDSTTSIDFMAEAVSTERPDIAMHAAADGPVTILFTDIESSTAITERLGDERWLEVLRDHNSVFRALAARARRLRGEEPGRWLHARLPRARAGRRVRRRGPARAGREREPVEGERVRVRIGLHTGEAIREEGDFFGRSVILAARIAAQARGGEILVSESSARRRRATA